MSRRGCHRGRAGTADLAGAAHRLQEDRQSAAWPDSGRSGACFRAGGWERAVLAPAFPYQGRITRDGRQHARDVHGNWSPIHDGDIAARLTAEGVPVHRGRLDEPLRPGISIFDAETDAELRRVAALGRATSGPVLWIGTGGLAQALAHGAPAEACGPLPRPLLGLFGSDQAVTAANWPSAAPTGFSCRTAAPDRRRCWPRHYGRMAERWPASTCPPVSPGPKRQHASPVSSVGRWRPLCVQGG
jgi:hypothetical protein